MARAPPLRPGGRIARGRWLFDRYRAGAELRVKTWVALATANERSRKAEHGGTGTSHSRTAPGTIRAISVDKAGLFFWRLRARRFVGSVTRRGVGPPAYRPSGGGPGCGFASGRAIPPQSQARGVTSCS